MPFLTILHDPDGGFGEAYGTEAGAILVRPDGHIGWRGASWRQRGLAAYFETMFPRTEPRE